MTRSRRIHCNLCLSSCATFSCRHQRRRHSSIPSIACRGQTCDWRRPSKERVSQLHRVCHHFQRSIQSGRRRLSTQGIFERAQEHLGRVRGRGQSLGRYEAYRYCPIDNVKEGTRWLIYNAIRRHWIEWRYLTTEETQRHDTIGFAKYLSCSNRCLMGKCGRISGIYRWPLVWVSRF